MDRQTDDYEEWQRRLKNDALRLKALAGQTPMQEWVDKFLGIVEREKVRELERYKEREYQKNHGGLHKALGGRLVEHRASFKGTGWEEG